MITNWVAIVSGLIKNPIDVWVKLFKSNQNARFHLGFYMAPWLLLIVFAALTRYSENGILNAALRAMLFVITNLGVIKIAPYIIRAFGRNHGAELDLNRLEIILIYSGTGIYAGQLLANLFYMTWMNVVGLYSVYLIWTAFEFSGEVDQEKRWGFMLISCFLIGCIQMIVYWFFSSIFQNVI